MKTLVLYQNIEGGTKNATEAIVRELVESKNDTYILYKQADISQTRRFNYSRHLIWSTWDFWRVLQKTENIDSVYFTIFTAAIAKAFSRHRRTPGLFHFHGNQEFASTLMSEQYRSVLGKIYNTLLGALVIWLQQFAFRHATVVCFVSEFAKRQFLRKQGLEALSAKTRVVPNGVDTHKFYPVDTKARKRLRKKNGNFSPSDFFILFSGRIDEKKGIMYLVNTLPLLPSRFKLIVAHPAMREHQSKIHYQNLLRSIHINRLNSRVFFVENPSKIEEWYQLADCTILPSEREYFSLVILESFACGTIFFGTRVGFIPEFLSGVDSNLIITSVHPAFLAKKIQWLAKLTNEKRRRIIQTGIQKTKLFTWRTAAQAILRELHAILS